MTLFDKYIKLFKNPFFLAAYCVVMIVSYFRWDLPVANYIHETITPAMKPVLQAITSCGKGEIYIIVLVALWVFFKYIYRKPLYAFNTLFVFVSLIFAGILCDIIKVVFCRTRPDLWFDSHLYGFQAPFKFTSNYWSFPSGHVTVVASVMVALSYLKPKLWPVFLLIALIIASSRILLNQHYVSDVLGAYLLGHISVILVHQYYYKPRRLPLMQIQV